MIIPRPPEDYNLQDQSAFRTQVQQADALNYKRNQDVEIAQGRLILKSPNGTRYEITVSNTGTLSATAI